MQRPGLMTRHLVGVVWFSAGMALTGWTGTADAAAGRFQFVYGEVRITGVDGQERVATRGSEVDEGDTISTTRRGTAQLRMADGAALAVRPRSQVRIDAYRFEAKPDSDRSFLSLLRGTLRSITGLVGRSNRSAYRVRTPTATIGIRGSDADIGFNPENGLTAVRTYTGGHSLTAPDGNGIQTTIDTNPGQIAIASPGQPPAFSNTFPFATPAPRAGAPGTGRQAQPRARARARARAGGESAPPPPGNANGQQPIRNPTQRRSVGGRIPLGNFAFSSPKIAPFGTTVAGAVLANQGLNKKALSGTVVANNVSTIVLDGGNRPLAVTDSSGGGNLQVLKGNAAIVGPARAFEVRNPNGDVVSQGNWGAYSNAVQVVENGIVQNAVSNFHFVTATDRTSIAQIQALGGTSFTYVFPPSQLNFSNELGNFAGTRSALASGNFTGNISVNVAASNFNGGSDTWNLSGTSSVADFIGNQGVALTGSSSAGAPSVATAAGRFVGPNAEGVVMSVSARTALGKGLVGTGVGFRQ